MDSDEISKKLSSTDWKIARAVVYTLGVGVLSLVVFVFQGLRSDISLNEARIHELTGREEPQGLLDLRKEVEDLKKTLGKFEERYAYERCKDLGGDPDLVTGMCKTEDGVESFKVFEGLGD